MSYGVHWTNFRQILLKKATNQILTYLILSGNVEKNKQLLLRITEHFVGVTQPQTPSQATKTLPVNCSLRVVRSTNMHCCSRHDRLPISIEKSGCSTQKSNHAWRFAALLCMHGLVLQRFVMIIPALFVTINHKITLHPSLLLRACHNCR